MKATPTIVTDLTNISKAKKITSLTLKEGGPVF